jgi:hypothetical protein
VLQWYADAQSKVSASHTEEAAGRFLGGMYEIGAVLPNLSASAPEVIARALTTSDQSSE